jgi:hypothetical protein
VPHFPATGDVGFYAAPVLPDTVMLNGMSMHGVKIATNASADVEIDLFSDGPTTGPWTIKAIDLPQFQGGASRFTFAFDKTTGQNGDKAKLTITPTVALPQGGVFVIQSKLGTSTSYWAGLVTN